MVRVLLPDSLVSEETTFVSGVPGLAVPDCSCVVPKSLPVCHLFCGNPDVFS